MTGYRTSRPSGSQIKLPRWIPRKPSILRLSDQENIPLLTAAALLGPRVLMPVLRHLLEMEGAHTNKRCSLHGADKALLAAVFADCAISVEALILGAGANPFTCVYNGTELGSATATHMAAARGKCLALNAILRLDPLRKSIDVIDATGLAPVHVAAACGHANIVRLLVHHDPAALLVRVHMEQASIFDGDKNGYYQNRFEHFAVDELTPYGEKEYNTLLSIRKHYRTGATPMHLAASIGCTSVIQEISRLAYVAENLGNVRCLNASRPTKKISVEELREQDKDSMGTLNDLARSAQGALVISYLQKSTLRDREVQEVVKTRLQSLHDQVFDAISEIIQDSANATAKSTEAMDNTRFKFCSISVQEVLDARNSINNAPVHLSCGDGSEEALHCLIGLGANRFARGFEGGTPLHYACMNGHAELAGALIKDYNLDIHCRDFYGFTPLHATMCFAGTAKVTQTLLNLGADCNNFTYFNENPMYLAAYYGNTESCKLLLQAGGNADVLCEWNDQDRASASCTLAREGYHEDLLEMIKLAEDCHNSINLNPENNGGCTILKWSVSASESTLRGLISAGVLVDVPDDTFKMTPLMNAAEDSTAENIRILLLSGANVNSVDDRGWSALQIATDSNDDVNCMKTLIEFGANVNTGVGTETPLHLAAYKNDAEKLRILLAAGADCDQISSEGKAPLHILAAQGSLASIKTLLHAGPKILARDEGRNYTPIHYAARRSDKYRWLVVAMLLDAGCHVDARGGGNRTPLHVACMVSMSEEKRSTVRLLLSRGASIDAVDADGNTALLHAASTGSIENILALIENGADINLRNERGDDSLLRAVDRGHMRVAVILLEHGAFLNSKNQYGETALVMAGYSRHYNLMEFLLNAAINALDHSDSGRSLIRYAANYGRKDYLRRLLDRTNSPLNTDAPKRTFQYNSPCASLDEQSETHDRARREERHELCEMDTSRENCPICRALLRDREEVRILTCQHVFHDECILSWLCSLYRSYFECPICKRSLWIATSESSNASDDD